MVAENRNSRTLLTVALIAAAAGLAFLGRCGLDWFVGIAPRWGNEIERLGGGALGLIIGLLVFIPVFRMYGVFGRKDDNARRPMVDAKSDVEVDDITKGR